MALSGQFSCVLDDYRRNVWHKANIRLAEQNVRFRGESGHSN